MLVRPIRCKVMDGAIYAVIRYVRLCVVLDRCEFSQLHPDGTCSYACDARVDVLGCWSIGLLRQPHGHRSAVCWNAEGRHQLRRCVVWIHRTPRRCRSHH